MGLLGLKELGSSVGSPRFWRQRGLGSRISPCFREEGGCRLLGLREEGLRAWDPELWKRQTHQ